MTRAAAEDSGVSQVTCTSPATGQGLSAAQSGAAPTQLGVAVVAVHPRIAEADQAAGEPDELTAPSSGHRLCLSPRLASFRDGRRVGVLGFTHAAPITPV